MYTYVLFESYVKMNVYLINRTIQVPTDIELRNVDLLKKQNRLNFSFALYLEQINKLIRHHTSSDVLYRIGILYCANYFMFFGIKYQCLAGLEGITTLYYNSFTLCQKKLCLHLTPPIFLT